ncbi:hypothetical protein [Robertmurraya sp. P23]|uniref:hypothetical protein n=1 Tax=Robertmurraya sp. P23 TaxID=3436931 RepID=UPI003D986755
MKTMYICQLPNEVALDIYNHIHNKLFELGFRNRDLHEFVENAMSGRICDLENMIDINKYLVDQVRGDKVEKINWC